LVDKLLSVGVANEDSSGSVAWTSIDGMDGVVESSVLPHVVSDLSRTWHLEILHLVGVDVLERHSAVGVIVRVNNHE